MHSTQKWPALRTAVLGLFVVAGSACEDDDDEAAPVVTAVSYLPADHSDPIDLTFYQIIEDVDLAIEAGELPEVPTTGTVAFTFSELLDGDVIESAVDADGNPVGEEEAAAEFIPGTGLATASFDGTGGAGLTSYDPNTRSVAVAFDLPAVNAGVDTFDLDAFPADTDVIVRIAPGIADKDGNDMTVPFFTAFHTAPLEVLSVDLPAWGAVDDPETADVDETVALDEPFTIAFNTPVDITSFSADSVRLYPVDETGRQIGADVPLLFGYADAEDPTVVAVTPAAPLEAATAYEVRVNPGITDLYGVELGTFSVTPGAAE